MSRRTSTTQKLARLKQLATDADANIYERIGLAIEILADLEWLGKNFEGDESEARIYLQDTYFRQLAGWISLDKLLHLHRDMPNETWQEYRFDLRAIESLWDEQQIADRQPTERDRKAWKSIAEDLQEDLQETKMAASQSKKLCEALESDVAQLRAENAELRRENAELRGRLSELQRILERNPVAV